MRGTVLSPENILWHTPEVKAVAWRWHLDLDRITSVQAERIRTVVASPVYRPIVLCSLAAMTHLGLLDGPEASGVRPLADRAGPTLRPVGGPAPVTPPDDRTSRRGGGPQTARIVEEL